MEAHIEFRRQFRIDLNKKEYLKVAIETIKDAAQYLTKHFDIEFGLEKNTNVKIKKYVYTSPEISILLNLRTNTLTFFVEPYNKKFRESLLDLFNNKDVFFSYEELEAQLKPFTPKDEDFPIHTFFSLCYYDLVYREEIKNTLLQCLNMDQFSWRPWLVNQEIPGLFSYRDYLEPLLTEKFKQEQDPGLRLDYKNTLDEISFLRGNEPEELEYHPVLEGYEFSSYRKDKAFFEDILKEEYELTGSTDLELQYKYLSGKQEQSFYVATSEKNDAFNVYAFLDTDFDKISKDLIYSFLHYVNAKIGMGILIYEPEDKKMYFRCGLYHEDSEVDKRQVIGIVKYVLNRTAVLRETFDFLERKTRTFDQVWDQYLENQLPFQSEISSDEKKYWEKYQEVANMLIEEDWKVTEGHLKFVKVEQEFKDFLELVSKIEFDVEVRAVIFQAYYEMPIHQQAYERLKEYLNQLNQRYEFTYFIFDPKGIRACFSMSLETNQLNNTIIWTFHEALINLIYRHYYGIKKRSRIVPPAG